MLTSNVGTNRRRIGIPIVLKFAELPQLVVEPVFDLGIGLGGRSCLRDGAHADDGDLLQHWPVCLGLTVTDVARAGKPVRKQRPLLSQAGRLNYDDTDSTVLNRSANLKQTAEIVLAVSELAPATAWGKCREQRLMSAASSPTHIRSRTPKSQGRPGALPAPP